MPMPMQCQRQFCVWLATCVWISDDIHGTELEAVQGLQKVGQVPRTDLGIRQPSNVDSGVHTTASSGSGIRHVCNQLIRLDGVNM